jgi:hypothetical protein
MVSKTPTLIIYALSTSLLMGCATQPQAKKCYSNEAEIIELYETVKSMRQELMVVEAKREALASKGEWPVKVPENLVVSDVPAMPSAPTSPASVKESPLYKRGSLQSVQIEAIEAVPLKSVESVKPVEHKKADKTAKVYGIPSLNEITKVTSWAVYDTRNIIEQTKFTDGSVSFSLRSGYGLAGVTSDSTKRALPIRADASFSVVTLPAIVDRLVIKAYYQGKPVFAFIQPAS